MSGGRDLPADAQAGVVVGSLLRRFLAGVAISVLAGSGFYAVFETRLSFRSDWESALVALALTVGPATACAFGYFRSLPEALGASAAGLTRTSWQRWSDFARLSAAVAILITWSAYGIVAAGENPRQTPEIFTLLVAALVVTYLIPASVVASEMYLARTMVRGDTIGGVGWRAAAKRLVGHLGSGLVKWLRAKPSLASGSTLVLASLILTTTLMGSCASVPHKGYEIVTGKAVWITAELAVSVRGATLEAIVAQAGRWAYVLGLMVSILGLAAVLAGRAGDALRRSRPLATLSGAVALFGVSDHTFAWVRLLFERSEALVSAVWVVLWALSIALWVWRARGDTARWDRARLFVMVLNLPILFSCLAFLGALSTGYFGYVIFVVGMLLVWWGLVQSQWEVADPT